MIEIAIMIKDGKVLDRYNDKECTFAEVAAALYSLEEMKINLMAKEFDSTTVEEDLG